MLKASVSKEVKRSRCCCFYDLYSIECERWSFTLGWEWICTVHGVVVDVDHAVVVIDVDHIVVVVDVGDLFLLIAGLDAPTATAPNEEGDEDDHKDPPPLTLNHFGSERILKMRLLPISEFGRPCRNSPLFHKGPVIFTFTAE